MTILLITLAALALFYMALRHHDIAKPEPKAIPLRIEAHSSHAARKRRG